MIQKSRAILFRLSTCAFLLLHLNLTLTQEILDEREFDYIHGSPVGPAEWGNIRPEWATCNTGEWQSPIDMTNPRVTITVLTTDVVTKYRACPSIAHNRGHDVMLELKGDAGTAIINNTVYNLRQIHWHSPSEHTVKGKRYAMELHMVHTSQDPKAPFPIAVLGAFYHVGHPDPFLTKLTPCLQPLLAGQNVTQAGVVDPNETLINNQRTYYRYIGSLTIPPCTQGVLWTLMKRTMSVSTQQIQLLRDAVHDSAEQNARPLQSVNGRAIDLFLPLFK